MRKMLIGLFLFGTSFFVQTDCFAQEIQKRRKSEKLDSLYINEVEQAKGKTKVLHAEPLYIDLIRDLGARKGEREWNIGLEMKDNEKFDTYGMLIEYEFAPVNRLGFEVELPFTFYGASSSRSLRSDLPGASLNALKLATQYTFIVSDRLNASFAIGYIHEFEFVPFKAYGKEKLLNGNVFSPFLVGAKRWGSNFHTMVYTGPVIEKSRDHNTVHTKWQWNSNLHYMIPGTRNFIGMEFNKTFSDQFNMVLRPQMRVGIADNLMVGIVSGIPIKRSNERLSSFIRMIYEPGHRHKS
jgi:hypothetical protein